MPAIVAWRTWYAGGILYRSEDIDWPDLPERGVIAIRLIMAELCESSGLPYVHLLYDAEYYFQVEIDGETKYGVTSDIAIYDGTGKIDEGGLIRVLYPGAIIKYGETIPDDEFETIMAQARSRDFD